MGRMGGQADPGDQRVHVWSAVGLFALTVLKVFLIDFQNISTEWRTLSFIGLGLLLMGTRVLYGRFSPRILNAQRAPWVLSMLTWPSGCSRC